MAEIAARRMDWREWPAVAPAWERIHGLSPEASFFLSREWVDCWLATFGEQLHPELLTFVSDGEVVGCCLLVWRTQWVRGIPLRRVYLNCAGEDEADSTCIEYNSVLSLPKDDESVAAALTQYLKTRYWDELWLPGMIEGGAGKLPWRGEVRVRPSHYVDLRAVRGGAGGFDAVLSAGTRQQIRRCRRLYEEGSGSCVLRVARTRQEAAEIFQALVELHEAAWKERGRAGVFGSAKFLEFHRRLIEAVFEAGRILLVEARAGVETIGALYSFVFRGRVCFYQSGFRYAADGRLKPGLLTHYLAIGGCLEDGAIEEYDFLAGDAQYKKSLGTASRRLEWVVVRRGTLGEWVFRGLRGVKRVGEGVNLTRRRGDAETGRGGRGEKQGSSRSASADWRQSGKGIPGQSWGD